MLLKTVNGFSANAKTSAVTAKRGIGLWMTSELAAKRLHAGISDTCFGHDAQRTTPETNRRVPAACSALTGLLAEVWLTVPPQAALKMLRPALFRVRKSQSPIAFDQEPGPGQADGDKTGQSHSAENVKPMHAALLVISR